MQWLCEKTSERREPFYMCCPYIPMFVTPTICGGSPDDKGGYWWEGRIVPLDEADDAFWEEVRQKYPTSYIRLF